MNGRDGARSLAELVKTTDDEVVRRWLADRGRVAVTRSLMEKLAAVDNKDKPVGSFGVCYDASADSYYGSGLKP